MSMGAFPLTSLGFGSVRLNSASEGRFRSVLRVIWLVSSGCLLKIPEARNGYKGIHLLGELLAPSLIGIY